MAGTDLTLAVLPEKQIVTWEQRRRLGPNISEDESADLLRLVSGMLDTTFECAVFRLCRLI
jgi:hypothetical protein